MNVLNFNKMRDELQKLFEVGEQRSHNLGNEISSIVNQNTFLPRNNISNDYERNVEYRALLRSQLEDEHPPHALNMESQAQLIADPNPYLLPHIEKSNQHSIGKVTFGRARHSSNTSPKHVESGLYDHSKKYLRRNYSSDDEDLPASKIPYKVDPND